jgi:hypothetical protein
MAKIRAKLLETDIKMRDLAEQVTAAKRQADDEVPAGDTHEFGLFDPADPLDQSYSARADAQPQTFDQAWAGIQAQQRASTPVRQSDTAALSQADQRAKDFARPATIENESKALEEWAAADTEALEAQRAAGKLDEADEALLKNGAEIEKEHLGRAKAMEVLAQCLIA